MNSFKQLVCSNPNHLGKIFGFDTFQVCSSSFVDETWITATYQANSSYIWPMDARTIASSHAQFLHSFCTLSQLSLTTIIIDSLGSVLISPQALTRTLLELKVNEQLDTIRSTGPWMLVATLVSTRLSLTGNQLISGLGTNTFTYMGPSTKDIASIDINTYETTSNTTCTCRPTINCVTPAAIYSNPIKQTLDNYDLNVNRTLVKGMQTACSPLESFLSSTLECYFDSTCLQLLVPNTTMFIPLNSSQTSRYFLNTTMEDIVNDLLVEEWSFQFSPEGYFNQCAPSTCAYSYTQQNTFLVIITTIAAVLSGLITVLRMIIPWLVEYFFKLKRKLARRAVTSLQTVTSWVEPAVQPSKLMTNEIKTI